jgi:HEAT repeat protein
MSSQRFLSSLLCLSLIALVGCSDRADSEEWSESHARLQTIGNRGHTGEDDVPFALDRLKNGSAGERVLAAWALGEIGHSAAEPNLREAFEDRNADVRGNALAALIKLQPADRVDLLARGLRDRDPFVQQTTLSQMPDVTPRALLDPIAALLVEAPDEAIRIGAADALGTARGEGVADALARGAADEAKDVRVHVAFALGKIEDSAAVPVLTSLLDDESWEVRANSVQSLGKYRDPEALEAIRRMVDDTNASVRAVALRLVEGG